MILSRLPHPISTDIHLHITEQFARHLVEARVRGGPQHRLRPSCGGAGGEPEDGRGDQVAGDGLVHAHVPLDVGGAHPWVHLTQSSSTSSLISYTISWTCVSNLDRVDPGMVLRKTANERQKYA